MTLCSLIRAILFVAYGEFLAFAYIALTWHSPTASLLSFVAVWFSLALVALARLWEEL